MDPCHKREGEGLDSPIAMCVTGEAKQTRVFGNDGDNGDHGRSEARSRAELLRRKRIGFHCIFPVPTIPPNSRNLIDQGNPSPSFLNYSCDNDSRVTI